MEMESRKLFIGGISWETNEDRLREYFQTFGEVLEAVIMKDRITGRARGFGFVVFADPAVAERVVLQKHMIYGKTVEAKKAVPRDDQTILNKSNSSIQGSPSPAHTKKIFVGGLASSVTEAEFKKYFSQFGTIMDIVVMYDHKTQRPRGFGFITYDSEETVDKVLQKTFHELNGKMVEVKQAVPKELSPGLSRNNQLGAYNNYGSSRISSLLNEYTRGYNSNAIGVYGIKTDNKYAPAIAGRGGFSPFGHGYGMDLNFEPSSNPNYGISLNSSSNLSLGRSFSPSFAPNVSMYGSPVDYAGSNQGNGSPLDTTARSLWGNGSFSYASNSASFSGAFMSSGSTNSRMASLGSIGENWGSSARGGSSLGFSNEDFSFGSGIGFGKNKGTSLGLESLHPDINGGYDGIHSDNNDGGSLYGDSTWLSSSSEMEGSRSHVFGIGTLEFMTRSPAAYVGGYDVTRRQQNGGIAA